jgi:flavodoxin
LYRKNYIRNITKGNKEIVDEEISKLTGADLFKVEPVNAYPYNYRECCDVAKAEVTNNIK